MSTSGAEMLGEAVAAEMEAMQNAGKQFESEMAKTRGQTQDLYASMFASMQRKKEPEMHPDTVRIAKIIDANPLLRLAVDKFVSAKLHELSAAVSSVLGVSPEDAAK